VTLLTDFGDADVYVGVMKGVILGLCPEAQIVDLGHAVRPQGVPEAGFLIEQAAPYFPEGTVHLIVVDPGVGTERRILAVEADRQHFVAPDNGVLTQVLAGVEAYRVFAVERREYSLPDVSETFQGRDVMAPVAARLACGLPAPAVGPEVRGDLVMLPPSRPVAVADGLEIHVIHVDRFGNLVTDLRVEQLLAWQQEQGVGSVLIEVGDRTVSGVRSTYGDAEPGELLAVVGSAGRLEIAINLGSAATVLGVGRGASLVVRPCA
jgi:S-adenosylmethionine hydrolase